jgi:hypothetical protein
LSHAVGRIKRTALLPEFPQNSEPTKAQLPARKNFKGTSIHGWFVCSMGDVVTIRAGL